MNLHPTDDAMVRWVTGELTGSQARALEEHVATCPTCSDRLASEAALDVVMHAAAELAEADDAPVLHLDRAPASPVVASGSRGWRQVFAAAAAVLLVVFAGRGLQDTQGLDRIEAPAHVASTPTPTDGPASWEISERFADPICEAPDDGADDETQCLEEAPSLLAMAEVGEPEAWSIASEAGAGGDSGCTTPVDTGESLTCDDWLSADDLAG